MPPPPLPELRRGRHARRRSLTLPLARCVLFSDLRHIWSPTASSLLLLQPQFHRHFSFIELTPHRTSAAPRGHRRQPPTPPPNPDPVQPELHRDPLVLLSPSNFVFPHPSAIPRSAGELQAPPPLGLPSNRRYKASPPRSRSPEAPHKPAETLRLLPRHPLAP
jgi:hypothetical protein